MSAATIVEPLCACLQHETATEVRQRAEDLDFDVLGIRDGADELIDGYVVADELRKGKCGEYRRRFRPVELISDSTSMINVLDLLAERSRVFVVSGNGVRGIITRADLEKPPVRLLAFGWVTLVEMHLTHLIERFYREDEWKAKLSSGRLAAAETLQRARERRNEEIGLVDCLQFCDKRDLSASHEGIREWLGFESCKECTRVLAKIEKLRDRVAHTQDLVTGTTWREVAETLVRTEQMLLRSDKKLEEEE